jgi:HlyD family secretion protein
VLFRIDDRDTRAQLAIAEAGIAQAQANADKLQHRLEYLSRLKGVDRAAISADAYTAAKDDASAAASAVGVARAEADRLRTQLDRLQVRAPSAGRVLEVNVRPGEMAGEAPSRPLMLLGNDSRMFLRIDIDENDAWRVRPTARAVAYLPGDPRHFIPLRFEYVEPYVKPKTSLTGQATERTDLRVLQVVYSFDRGELPVYLGQQMDAFIEVAAPAGSR